MINARIVVMMTKYLHYIIAIFYLFFCWIEIWNWKILRNFWEC